mmetsp:Transcript_53148/g.99625  ORF Transcript_53148/g.99625 Transcript_53148/m.99625 type:complete len:720 (+) Transcript_53148:60-2219(+)
MGDGLSKDADRPLNLSEVTAMWRKHNVNDSNLLEKPEAVALIDDVRRRYGLTEPLPKDFVDDIFDELDGEGLKGWTWHDVRLLGGPTYHQLKKRIQRRRMRVQQRPHRANRDKSKAQQTYLGAIDHAWGEAIGRGAAVAEAKSARENDLPFEEVDLIFHPLRAERVKKKEGSLTFNPIVEVRVVRGNPYRGCPEFTDALSLASPCVVQSWGGPATGHTTDATWTEPIKVPQFRRDRAMYIHIIINDSYPGGMGLEPIADAVLKLDDVLKYSRVHQVRWFPLRPIVPERADPGGSLVGQWGGEEIPRFTSLCTVVRAENAPEENLLVDVELFGYGSDCVLTRGRSACVGGPHAEFQSEIPLDYQDETKMELQLTLVRRSFGVTEERIAELPQRLRQEVMRETDEALKLPLRPIVESETKVAGNAFLVVSFNGAPIVNLVVRPGSAANLFPPEDASSFNPFIDVRLLTTDPRQPVAQGPTLRRGQTETLSNVLGDPEWKTPVIFDFVKEQGMFLRLVACDSSSTTTTELADLVLPLKDVLPLQESPLERKYPLRLMVPGRKHDNPYLFLSFGNISGPVPREESSMTKLAPKRYGGKTGVVQIAPDFDVDYVNGLIEHGSILPLREFMETHGQAVPGVLKSPFRPISKEALSVPPMLAEALHHQTGTGKEQSTFVNVATERGGKVHGPVPLSFLASNSNPHFNWLFPMQSPGSNAGLGSGRH